MLASLGFMGMRSISRPAWHGRLLAASLLVLVCARPAARAQEAAPASPDAAPGATPTVTQSDEISAKRAALAGEVEELRGRQTAAPDDLAKALELLQRIDLLYGQQSAALQQQAELTAAKSAAEQELKTLRAKGLAEPPPYSFLSLDGLQDEIDREVARLETLAAAVSAATEALEQAKSLSDERESARRRAKEKLETNTDPSAVLSLETALRRRELESRAAGELVRVRELELDNETLARDGHELRVTFVREKAQRFAEHVRFTRAELQDQLAKLDREEAELNRSLETAKFELEAAGKRWLKARQRHDLSPNPSRALIEEVEARRAAQQRRQDEVAILGQRLQHVVELKQVWTRRFQIATRETTRAELAGWDQEMQQALDQLQREARLQQTRLGELEKQQLSLNEESTAAIASAPDAARWLRDQQEQLAARAQLYGGSLESLDQVRRLHLKLVQELTARAATRPLSERLSVVWQRLQAIWAYELTAVEDRPITVGKLVTGLALLALGILVSGFLSRQLGERLLPRFGLETGAALALESLAYYVLVLAMGLFALHVVNVPLTAFTILGGAVAIGIGFGSQNIVNNFISGLILLFERPIKVGDLIELDGTNGIVERIGPRSTRVRSGSNTHIIVPNSALLEKSVVNWTLSDDQVRTCVGMGVAYGSSTRAVERLIRRAVDEHPKILRTPEPIILFSEFGSDALIFEAHFWVRIRSLMDRKVIESDLRYRIDDLFREANITIAFPQRELHVGNRQPFEVRLLSNVGAPEMSAGNRGGA